MPKAQLNEPIFTRENVIFDDVTITSKLHSDTKILKADFTCFSKTYH